MQDRVAVIGLGKMGRALAERLAVAGVRVTGWTRSGATSDHFAVAPTLEAAVAGAQVLILSLFDDVAVRAVLARLATCGLTGRLVVETSTVSPAVVREGAAGVVAAGGRIIDAPISGGPDMVAAGTIGLFLGGDAADLDRFAPLAACLTDRVVRVGPLGSGAAAKIVNNVALAGAYHALVDAMALGDAMGLTLDTMLGILGDSPAANPFFRGRIAKITGADATVGVTIDTVRKDNAMFLDTAATFGVSLPELDHATARLRAAVAEGLGGQDPAALVRFVLAHGAVPRPDRA